jgi:hypothetical protein
MMQVVTQKTLITGTGRHRRRVTRSVVVYRTALHGTADRHGRFTARLRIAYRPARMAPARLSVTALKGCSSAAHTVGLTILPRSQPSFIESVTPRYLAAGRTLLVRIGTVARARVTVALQVVTKKAVVAGKGRPRRVVRTVVLYQTTARGLADAHGRYTGRLRVTYRPPKAAQALLRVTVSTPHGTSKRTSPVTL